jgi:hypothetical protein
VSAKWPRNLHRWSCLNASSVFFFRLLSGGRISRFPYQLLSLCFNFALIRRLHRNYRR